MALPFDVDRCSGDGCHVRAQCRRYVERLDVAEDAYRTVCVALAWDGSKCENQMSLRADDVQALSWRHAGRRAV